MGGPRARHGVAAAHPYQQVIDSLEADKRTAFDKLEKAGCDPERLAALVTIARMDANNFGEELLRVGFLHQLERAAHFLADGMDRFNRSEDGLPSLVLGNPFGDLPKQLRAYEKFIGETRNARNRKSGLRVGAERLKVRAAFLAIVRGSTGRPYHREIATLLSSAAEVVTPDTLKVWEQANRRLVSQLESRVENGVGKAVGPTPSAKGNP